MKKPDWNLLHLAARTCLLLAALVLPRPGLAEGLPHHDIAVSLDPAKHALNATDRISLPPGSRRQLTFALHEGLKPEAADPAVRVVRKGSQRGSVPLEVYEVTLPEAAAAFDLRFSGTIDHGLVVSKNQARGFDQTPGTIADEGIYLAGTSAWYPLLDAEFMTFTLTVELPEGWDAVSQGGRSTHERTRSGTRVVWNSPEPQNEIYLIASRFSAYEKQTGGITAQVYLREPDSGLAEKYLDATGRYVAMYDKLIGAYPYQKFALVENFWETGFGMPSFTLLGPTVLRLPFIINTSYPHEILHNWWGNSVYPVYEKGNWSEGLTAYLADHLLKEQQGGGAEYRLNTLQKYADYVLDNRDFPLTQFTSRHSASTEAVGYGKSLMFFHMLRLRMGDKAFIAGLRDLYRNYRFRFAAFPDVRKSFESASGISLEQEFEEWVTRTGAPEIRLEEAKLKKAGEGTKEKPYTLTVRMKQVQKGGAYGLRVPVAVTMEGEDRAFQTVLELRERAKTFEIATPARPVRIDVDPEFDLFRRLDRGEIPPAITQALGAKSMLVLLPASAQKELLDAYRAFADSLSAAGPDEVRVQLDTEVSRLPSAGTVVLLGWENRFLGKALPAWKDYGVNLEEGSVRIGRTEFPKKGHAVVLTGREPGSRDQALMFIAADGPAALPGLGRKLPHYHKYSYLVFEGAEPANTAKGRWPVVNSPLTVLVKDNDGRARPADMATLAAREALASPDPVYSEERMMETVKFLASDRLQGRETGSAGADLAAEYIADTFRKLGLLPGGNEGSYFQTAKTDAEPGGLTIRNVLAVLPGKNQKLNGQSVVLGAHYDHLGLGERIGRPGDRGRIHPGADDNASGVAVLLELARVLKESTAPDRSIVFAAWSGEEQGKLGSRAYVKSERTYPAAKCMGMVNLDTVGRLNKNKLLVLGGNSAQEWVHIFRGAGFATGVDIEMVSEDLDASDQKSFQAAGVPAVQLFSGPNLDYHRPTDTPDKIDAAGLVKIASVAGEVVEYLAGREQPLTPTASPGGVPGKPKTERKAGLGTIPDFGYSGSGVRLSGVVEGSPAAAAGMKEGDIITGLGGSVVRGLKDLSDALRSLQPGSRTRVTFLRDGAERTVEAELKAR